MLAASSLSALRTLPRLHQCPRRLLYTMSDSTGSAAKSNGQSGTDAGTKEHEVIITSPLDEGPRKLKILMLHGTIPFLIYFSHFSLSSAISPITAITTSRTTPADASFSPGYTQSAPLFHAKTRALLKTLSKAFPSSAASPIHSTFPGGLALIYPTGPIKLHPADLPYDLPPSDQEFDAWAWWKKSDNTGAYEGLEEGLERIRSTIADVGGVDGVMGFSQGGAAALLVASLLERGRSTSFSTHLAGNASAFPYPPGWEMLQPSPLKFCVSYSGFISEDERYKAFYEPKLQTKTLSVVGSLDSVVEESRSSRVADVCVNANTVVHPGGHFVPVSKVWAGALVGFLRDVLVEKKEEEEGEDDFPF